MGFLYLHSLPCDFVAAAIRDGMRFPNLGFWLTSWLFSPIECSRINFIPFLSLRSDREFVRFWLFSSSPPVSLWINLWVGWMRVRVEKNWVSSGSWTCDKAQSGSAKPLSCPQKHVWTPLNSAQMIRYAQLTHRLVIKNNCLLPYATEVLFLFVMQRYGGRW